MTSTLERRQTSQKDDSGDFQTPPLLAGQIVDVIRRKGIQYKAAIEPTCGVGNILFAAADGLPDLEMALGIEINPEYVETASKRRGNVAVEVLNGNFFELNFAAVTAHLAKPYIFIGNPPWVTNAAVGQLRSPTPSKQESETLPASEVKALNLPRKENFTHLSGFDAMTGKSNFDISEWIMLRLLEAVTGTANACAMLIKTSVARKIVAHAARMGLAVTDFELYTIDAKREFDVTVSACLFYFRGCPEDQASYTFTAFADLSGRDPVEFTYENGTFINDQAAYQRTQVYARQEKKKGGWRSGIKHDAAKVMELRRVGRQLLTAEGVPLDIEPTLLYPFLKSSDIAKGNTSPRIFTIVTQSFIGEDTEMIRSNQPLTWAYLEKNLEAFDSRKSSIYKDKPPFSIFGVGKYSFALYKIAISGLYKRLKFTLLEPLDGKCIMVDDTCYFLGFNSRQVALIYLSALESNAAREFFESRIEWDEKRPIKKDILENFNIELFIQTNSAEIRARSIERGVLASEFDAWFTNSAEVRLLI